MGGVAAPLAVEINGRIARVVHRLLVRAVLALEALVAGPCLNQGAVNCEVLAGQQRAAAGLRQHFGEQSIGNAGGQQPLAILGEHRHIPHRIIDVHSHKPAEQQIVAQLLHQHPLAAHRIKHLQQQRSQQLLRRNRGPSYLRVHRIKLRPHVA